MQVPDWLAWHACSNSRVKWAECSEVGAPAAAMNGLQGAWQVLVSREATGLGSPPCCGGLCALLVLLIIPLPSVHQRLDVLDWTGCCCLALLGCGVRADVVWCLLLSPPRAFALYAQCWFAASGKGGSREGYMAVCLISTG